MKQISLLIVSLLMVFNQANATLQSSYSNTLIQTLDNELNTSFAKQSSESLVSTHGQYQTMQQQWLDDDNLLIEAQPTIESAWSANIRSQDTMLYIVVAFELLISLMIFLKLGKDYLRSNRPYQSLI